MGDIAIDDVTLNCTESLPLTPQEAATSTGGGASDDLDGAGIAITICLAVALCCNIAVLLWYERSRRTGLKHKSGSEGASASTFTPPTPASRVCAQGSEPDFSP